MAYGFAILCVCVCVLSRFIIYGLKIIASTFADISLLLVDRTVFPKVRAVAASVQHLRNTHFPDLVMLTLQQLCEAVKKRGVAGWKPEKQILGGQFWPAPFKCIVLKQAWTSWWEGSGYASWLFGQVLVNACKFTPFAQLYKLK